MAEDAAQEERLASSSPPSRSPTSTTRAIAPAIIESCPTRLFLPNERAIEPQITAIYRRFGLNDRQIEILARATPKRDYYCQSRRGNRLFELGLGEVALAFTAASSKSDQARSPRCSPSTAATALLPPGCAARGLAWAADLIAVDLVSASGGSTSHEHRHAASPRCARGCLIALHARRFADVCAGSRADRSSSIPPTTRRTC